MRWMLPVIWDELLSAMVGVYETQKRFGKKY